LQAFSFGIVVKDTSVEPVRAPRNRRGGLRAGSDVRLPWWSCPDDFCAKPNILPCL